MLIQSLNNVKTFRYYFIHPFQFVREKFDVCDL